MNENTENEITEQDIINELKYLIDEGFVVYNAETDTYRLKTKKELKSEMKNL